MLARHKNILMLIGWTIAAAIISFPIYLHNQRTCNSTLLGQDGCDIARQAGAGPTFWQPFVPIWLIGLVVGGIVLLVIRSNRRTTAAP